MSSIMIHVLDDNGYYYYDRIGDIASVLLAVDIESLDYTLTPPPTGDKKWRWVNNKWTADDTAE